MKHLAILIQSTHVPHKQTDRNAVA